MKFTFFFFTSVICITEKAKERTRGFDKCFIRATVFIVYQIVNRPLIFLKRGGGGEFEQLAMQKAGRLSPSIFFEMGLDYVGLTGLEATLQVRFYRRSLTEI